MGSVLQVGDVVGLRGDLGAGKSELARAVIWTVAGSEIEVPSPTFTLIQTYHLPNLLLGHADFYRIGSPDEVEGLGLENVVQCGALLVEWPELAYAALPVRPLLLTLEEAIEPEERILTIKAPSSWQRRLARLLP